MSEREGIVGAPTADGIEIIPRPEAARWDAKRGPKSRKRNRGLGTVYRRDDGPWYWVQYSVRGRQRREPANTTDEQAARDFLRDRLAEAARGAPLSRGKVTLAQLAEMVIQDYENNDRKSTVRVRCHFRHLQDFFGGDALAVDLPAQMRRYISDRRKAGAAASTIRSEVHAGLGRGLTLAFEAKLIGHRERLPRVEVNNTRTGFFTDAEIAVLLPLLPEYMRPFTEAAYITGWRRGELRELCWTQVDWETGSLRLERGTTKSGEPRQFPFTAHRRLAAIIRVQRERTSAGERKTGRLCPWVFHRDGHQVAWFYDGWHTACTKAGVPGRLFHDLRRSAVRNLTRAGINESVAMKISGHETNSVFKRYDIISNADVTDAVRKLAGLGKVIPIRGGTRKGRKASR